jgi:hypothetical protein
MSQLPQHLETRRRHIRQQRQAELVIAGLRCLAFLVLAIAAISILYPK